MIHNTKIASFVKENLIRNLKNKHIYPHIVRNDFLLPFNPKGEILKKVHAASLEWFTYIDDTRFVNDDG